MSDSRHHRSLGDLLLLALLFMCLSGILWRALRELPYRDEFLRERMVWDCLFSTSYGALLIVLAKLVSSGSNRLTFLRIRFAVSGTAWGVIPSLLLWYFLAEVGKPPGLLGAVLASAFEISTVLGKILLITVGRPSALLSEYFPLGYEEEQFLLFLPLNAMGWFGIAEGGGLLWRRLLSRMPRAEAVLLIGATVAFCCGLLAFWGSWELTFTVDLIVGVSQVVIGGLSLGLIEVHGPGILPASLYFLLCVLMLFGAFKRLCFAKVSF